MKIQGRAHTSLVRIAVHWHKCGQCSATYVGETSRHLITRVCDHKDISRRTGKQILAPPSSSIRDHLMGYNHQVL